MTIFWFAYGYWIQARFTESLPIFWNKKVAHTKNLFLFLIPEFNLSMNYLNLDQNRSNLFFFSSLFIVGLSDRPSRFVEQWIWKSVLFQVEINPLQHMRYESYDFIFIEFYSKCVGPIKFQLQIQLEIPRRTICVDMQKLGTKARLYLEKTLNFMNERSA